MEYKVYKVVEREGKVFGLSFVDFSLVGILLLMVLFGGNALGTIIDIPMLFYPISTILIVILFVILRIANKKKHPSFLLSFLCAKFLLPKHLTFKTIPQSKRDGFKRV